MLALAFGSVNSELMAQALPTSMTINSALLYKTAATDVDSATVSATLPYFIYPDVNFNPNFSDSDPLNATKLESTFTWPGTTANYTIAPVTGYTGISDYKNITWINTGSYSLSISETAAATYGGCSGNTTLKVDVIKKPTAAFTNAGVLICPNSTTVDLPITVTTDIAGTAEKQMQFTITCSKGGTPFAISGTDGKYAEGASTTTVTATTGALTEGIYTFTLSSVSDRISRKCGVSGTIGTQTTYTVYVFAPKPTLKTSAIK